MWFLKKKSKPIILQFLFNTMSSAPLNDKCSGRRGIRIILRQTQTVEMGKPDSTECSKKWITKEPLVMHSPCTHSQSGVLLWNMHNRIICTSKGGRQLLLSSTVFFIFQFLHFIQNKQCPRWIGQQIVYIFHVSVVDLFQQLTLRRWIQTIRSYITFLVPRRALAGILLMLVEELFLN